MKKLLPTALLVALVAGLPLALAGGKAAKSAKPERIAFGQEVSLADYAVAGKTTVFDFTSNYCPPCRQIAPLLDRLHESRDDVVVVAVDINRPDVKGIDWKSPVARQYKLNSVPHFKVFGPDGKLQVEGDAASKLVFGWFEQL